MAIRILKTLVLSLAVLLLGSCDVLQYIFGSVFPSTLTLVKAQADLSGMIDAAYSGSFNIRVVESGTYGYVVVSGSNPTTGVNSMFFYDLDLNLRLDLSGAQAPAGTGVMAGANPGEIAAGMAIYDSKLSPIGGNPGDVTLNSTSGAGNDGFVIDNSGTNTNAVNISVTGNTLTFTHYQPTWGFLDPHNTVLSASLSALELDAVFDDGDPSGNVIFVVSQPGSSDSGTRYFVSESKLAMSAGTVPANPLDTVPPPPHRDNLRRDSLGFANGSIFGYDKSASSFVRINPVDASTQESLSLGDSKDKVTYAYRLSGGSFYSFDTNTRILTELVPWWKR
jgi:hypothetical protein